MKIALLGSTGMLGSKMAEILKAKGHELLAPSHSQVDLNRPYTIENYFKDQTFDVLVNCAGFTRVDACEEPAKFSMVLNVNGTSAGWLAKYCKRTHRILVHFSTDYVFNGQKEEPYLETDKPDPLNTYGKTKWQGEKLLRAEDPFYYLIRTSWFFGPKGDNFVSRMADLLMTKPRIEVVDDQVGGPTYSGDLAQFTMELLEKKAKPGLYHFSNAGSVSWFEFAQEIQKQTGYVSCEIAPVSSENVFRPAQRPANSQFDLSKATGAVGHAFRVWQEALGDYLMKDFNNEPA